MKLTVCLAVLNCMQNNHALWKGISDVDFIRRKISINCTNWSTPWTILGLKKWLLKYHQLKYNYWWWSKCSLIIGYLAIDNLFGCLISIGLFKREGNLFSGENNGSITVSHYIVPSYIICKLFDSWLKYGTHKVYHIPREGCLLP